MDCEATTKERVPTSSIHYCIIMFAKRITGKLCKWKIISQGESFSANKLAGWALDPVAKFIVALRVFYFCHVYSRVDLWPPFLLAFAATFLWNKEAAEPQRKKPQGKLLEFGITSSICCILEHLKGIRIHGIGSSWANFHLFQTRLY